MLFLQDANDKEITYSQTSRKGPPKMRRPTGRLWEVVAFENLTTGDLFQEEVQTHLLYGR